MPEPEGSRKRSREPRKPRAESAGSSLDRVPPHSLDAERALLCACILDHGGEVLTDCVDAKLRPDSFFALAHQYIYEAMLGLYERGSPIEVITLYEELEKRGLAEEVGGPAFIEELADAVDTTIFYREWLELIREKAMIRRMIRVCTKTVEECYAPGNSLEEFLESVEEEIFMISQDRVSESAQHIREPIESAVKQIHHLINNQGASYGVRTGLIDLDKMTMGFHPGQMIVLAARPSLGKTSLAMNIAESAVCPSPSTHAKPAPTLVFSLEMTSDQLAMRLLTGRGRVDSKRVRDGTLGSEEQKALVKAATELKGAPLYIDDTAGMSVLELRAKGRRLASKLQNEPLQLVVVDYLQLLHGTNSTVPREQQIAEISRGLKAMAKELDVPVLVLSQLNRDSEKEKRRPRLSDLRESGSIEQDADVVMLLHRSAEREDSEDGETRNYSPMPGDVERINLIVAKQRNGPVGELPLTFRRQYTRFENSME